MQQPRAVIPDFSTPGSAIGLGWRIYHWAGRTIIGHDGDTVASPRTCGSTRRPGSPRAC